MRQQVTILHSIAFGLICSGGLSLVLTTAAFAEEGNRQLASVQGLSKAKTHSHSSKKPSKTKQVTDPPLLVRKGDNVQINLPYPTEIDEGWDYIIVSGKRLQKVGQARFQEVVAWCTRLYKQLNSNPAYTPTADPYCDRRGRTDLAKLGAKNYISQEGRLQTVVNR